MKYLVEVRHPDPDTPFGKKRTYRTEAASHEEAAKSRRL